MVDNYNGHRSPSKSERSVLVAKEALEWLKAGTSASQVELASVIADVLCEKRSYVQKAISEWFRSATGEWAHVHATRSVDATGHAVQVMHYDATRTRGAEEPTTERWRHSYTANAVVHHLRVNRGQVFTAEQLVEGIGFPSTPHALRVALSNQRPVLKRHGVVVGRSKERPAFTYCIPSSTPKPEPVEPVEVVEPAPSPFTAVAAVVFDEVSDTIADVPVDSIVQRYADAHVAAVQQLTEQHTDWLEPVGRNANGDRLYRRGDGVVGLFQPV